MSIQIAHTEYHCLYVVHFRNVHMGHIDWSPIREDSVQRKKLVEKVLEDAADYAEYEINWNLRNRKLAIEIVTHTDNEQAIIEFTTHQSDFDCANEILKATIQDTMEWAEGGLFETLESACVNKEECWEVFYSLRIDSGGERNGYFKLLKADAVAEKLQGDTEHVASVRNGQLVATKW